MDCHDFAKRSLAMTTHPQTPSAREGLNGRSPFFKHHLTRRSIARRFWALRRKNRLRLAAVGCRLRFFQARSKASARQAVTISKPLLSTKNRKIRVFPVVPKRQAFQHPHICLTYAKINLCITCYVGRICTLWQGANSKL